MNVRRDGSVAWKEIDHYLQNINKVIKYLSIERYKIIICGVATGRRINFLVVNKIYPAESFLNILRGVDRSS